MQKRKQAFWLFIHLILLALVVSFTARADQDAHLVINHAVKAQMTKGSATDGSDRLLLSIVSDTLTTRLLLEKNQRFNSKARELEVSPDTIYYKGGIPFNDNTWARFTETQGVLKGAYYDGAKLFFIEQAADVVDVMSPEAASRLGSVSADQLLLIEAADMSHTGTCAGHDHLDPITGAESLQQLNQELSALAAIVPRSINIELVGDVEWNSAFGGNGVAQMLSEMNIVDGIYSAQLGLTMNIVGSRTLSNNGSLTSTNPNTLIGAFRGYVSSNIGNPGLTHLFTGKNLNGSVIGIAYLSTVCGSFGVGITQRFGNMTALVAAHEFAHNLGSPHDNQSGSVCASTPNGFLMNPSINGSDEFSQCSIDQMLPRIESASCIVETSGVAPEITSVASLIARVGEAYQYNSDNQVTATGDNLAYNLDFGPQGMTMSDTGLLSWTPVPGQEGSQPTQITVSNANGNDTQTFDIQVSTPFVTFNELPVQSYGNNQDITGEFDIAPDGNGITLSGNTWKRIPFDYQVTPNTVIELVFSAPLEGEIQGIGVDDDDQISENRTFNLYGTQSWGIRAQRYSGSGGDESFTLPIGQYVTGQMNYLVFVNDEDVPSPSSASSIKNIRVYENEAAVNVDFNLRAPTSYAGAQDVAGTVTVIEGGAGLALSGNRWQKISLPVTLTPDSVLSFEFRSDSQGEIHGIGFDSDDVFSEDRSFRLYGTQTWGINNFATYTGNGDFQSFTIPVGQFYTGSQTVLFFINDQDVNNPSAQSEFRNIQIRN